MSSQVGLDSRQQLGSQGRPACRSPRWGSRTFKSVEPTGTYGSPSGQFSGDGGGADLSSAVSIGGAAAHQHENWSLAGETPLRPYAGLWPAMSHSTETGPQYVHGREPLGGGRAARGRCLSVRRGCGHAKGPRNGKVIVSSVLGWFFF